jgi:hypothetical protein
VKKEGKKELSNIEQGMSNIEGWYAPKARFLFTAIDHDAAPSSGTN